MAGSRPSRTIGLCPWMGGASPPMVNKSSWLEQLTDRLFQLLRFGLGRITRHRLAGAIDQEFREIPFDVLTAEQARLGLFEIFVKRMGMGAVDLDLGEHRKT